MEREPLLRNEPQAKRSRWLIILAGVLIVGLVGGLAFENIKSHEVSVADDGLHGYTEPTETLAVELGDRTQEEKVQQAEDAAEEPPPPAAEGQPAPVEPAPAQADATGAPEVDATGAPSDGTGEPGSEGTSEPGVDVVQMDDATTAPPAEPQQPGDVTTAPAGGSGADVTEPATVDADAQITADQMNVEPEGEETETTHPAQVNPDCSDEMKALIHNCMTMNNASQKEQCNAAPSCEFKDDGGCDFGYTTMQCVPKVTEACLYDIEIDDGDDLFAVMQPDASCPQIDSSASQIALVLATTLFICAWV